MTPREVVPEDAALQQPARPAADVVPLFGRVLRRGDRVALRGVTVILDGGAREAQSDADGRFSFLDLVVGRHTLDFRSPQTNPAHAEETLKQGKRLDATYYLQGKERYLSVVRAERAVKETVETQLSMEEIKHIAGTQGDALKSVQSLPGVARTPFGLGQLVVWGSSPEDTRAFVDGVYIPTLYHFAGLRSTVQADMISSLTFMPGGYGVDFGRGLGGVVDLESRKPRSDGYHGFIQLDTIDGSLMLEGPITKTLSFAVAARRSWIDVFLPLFTPNNFQLSPQYTDYQLQIDWRPTARDELRLFLFGSDDSVKLVLKNGDDPALSAQFDSHSDYHRLLVRWLHRFSGGATLTVTPYGGYEQPANIKVDFAGQELKLAVDTFTFGARAVARIPLARFLRLDAGVDYEGAHFAASASGSLTRAFGTNSDVYELFQDEVAPYLATVFRFFDGRLLVTPQLRADVYSFIGNDSVAKHFERAYLLWEPRLTARMQIAPWLALKGAVGVYHQPPNSSNFSGVIGTPDIKPESATHYVLGVDVDPTSFLHVEVQGFYKDMRDLVVGGEHLGDAKLVNDGLGRVYGGELLLRLEPWKNLYGWVSYTLSRAERKDHPDQDWHVFQYDQTHILTVVASYKLPRGFQVGLRFRYVTGNPYTPVLGAYYDAKQDTYVPIRAATNSGRLDGFNQLDLRVDKTWTYDWWKLSLYVDIQNVYNASNPEAVTYNYNYTQSAPISGLPFFPAVGIRGEL